MLARMINITTVTQARMLKMRPFLNLPIRRWSLISTSMIIRMTAKRTNLGSDVCSEITQKLSDILT